jgi:hypothetical protein
VLLSCVNQCFCFLVEALARRRPERFSSSRPSRSPTFSGFPPFHKFQLREQHLAFAGAQLNPGSQQIHSRTPQSGRSGGAWSSQTQRESTQLQRRRPGRQREGGEVSLPVPHRLSSPKVRRKGGYTSSVINSFLIYLQCYLNKLL